MKSEIRIILDKDNEVEVITIGHIRNIRGVAGGLNPPERIIKAVKTIERWVKKF